MGKRDYPCRCLCFGFEEQITRTIPFLLIILQRLHIFLTDGRTFIVFLSICFQQGLLSS